MTELPAGFVNPFLNSSGVLDFHSVAVYSFSPPDDFQEATNSQKQLNFTYSFMYLLFVAIFFFPQSSCDIEVMKILKKSKFLFFHPLYVFWGEMLDVPWACTY